MPALDLPVFRYHPDPINSKVFEPSIIPCPCCGKARGLSYVGPAYAIAEIDNLCPWCIADGSAASKFDVTFVAAFEDSTDSVSLDELLHRTPGFFAAQEDPWPAHCNDFCAIQGRVGLAQVLPLRSQLRADLRNIRAYLEISWRQFLGDLSRPASPLWAHLFQCLHCGRHRLIANYE